MNKSIVYINVREWVLKISMSGKIKKLSIILFSPIYFLMLINLK